HLQGVPAGVSRAAPELLFDAQELVVLGRALAARRRAGLDLADARRDGEVRDERILGLAAAVADHARPAGIRRHANRLERLGQRADLVQLDEHAVRGALEDAAFDALRVRDEEVVADELDAVPQAL